MVCVKSACLPMRVNSFMSAHIAENLAASRWRLLCFLFLRNGPDLSRESADQLGVGSRRVAMPYVPARRYRDDLAPSIGGWAIGLDSSVVPQAETVSPQFAP